MGFTINKHYCGGELKFLSINKKSEPCPMCKKMAELPTCHKSEKKGCCENDQDEVKTSEFHLTKKVEKQNTSDFQLIALTYIILEDIHFTDVSIQIDYKNYAPPLIEHDIPIEVQSFLL